MPKPTKTAAAQPSPEPETPAKVRLLRPFGFYDQDGRHRAWRAATIVTDPDEIAVLAARGAPTETLGD